MRRRDFHFACWIRSACRPAPSARSIVVQDLSEVGTLTAGLPLDEKSPAGATLLKVLEQHADMCSARTWLSRRGERPANSISLGRLSAA